MSPDLRVMPARAPVASRSSAQSPACLILLGLVACEAGEMNTTTGSVGPERVRVAEGMLGRYPVDPADPESPDIVEGAFRLTVGEAGIFVLDVLGTAVLRFDGDARLVSRFGSPGDGPGELHSPTGLVAGRDGLVHVADPAASRIVTFEPDGRFVDDRRTAYPPVNFAATASGELVLPTMSARTLFASLSPDGTIDLEIDPRLVPTEISGDPTDRISMGGLLMAGLDDGAVVLFQNRHGTRFRMWRVELDSTVQRIQDVRPLPLPGWIYTILEEETERVRRSVPEAFAQGDFLVPFKGLHAVDGQLWLVPTPSSRVLAMSVDPREGGSNEAVIAAAAVTRGLIDAAVRGDRLYALYETELRVYGLRTHEGSFPMP